MIILGHELKQLHPERSSYKDYYCKRCNIYVWIVREEYFLITDSIYYSKLSREKFLQSNPMTRIGEILDITCDELIIKNIIE